MSHRRCHLALSAAFGVAVLASAPVLADESPDQDPAPPGEPAEDTPAEDDAALIEEIIVGIGEIFDGPALAARPCFLPRCCHPDYIRRPPPPKP